MIGLALTVWQARELISYLVSSQMRSSLHRTVFGSFLHFLVPLMNVLVYYFLIVIIFGREGAYDAGAFITVLIGVIHYFMLTNGTTYTMPTIYSSESVLLQLRIEPVVMVAAGFWKSLRISAFGVIIMFAFLAWLGPPPSLRWLAYPVILAMWIGTLWLILMPLALLVMFVRDLDRLAPVLLAFLMYLSPVIYTVAMVPKGLSGVYELNPLTFIFTMLQWSLLGGPPASLLSCATYAGFIVLASFGGLALYRRARPMITKSF